MQPGPGAGVHPRELTQGTDIASAQPEDHGLDTRKHCRDLGSPPSSDHAQIPVALGRGWVGLGAIWALNG